MKHRSFVGAVVAALLLPLGLVPAAHAQEAAGAESGTNVVFDAPELDSEQGPTGKRVLGLAAIGGGVVAGGLALRYAFEARDLSEELERATAWAAHYQDKLERGDAAERNAIIAAGAGAALLTTGIVLYVMGGPDDEAEGVSIAPTTGAQGTGVAVWGRF